MNTQWIHVVARTHFRNQIFNDRDVALHAWQRLRATFPVVLAAMLMPEHLHLVVARAKDTIWRLGVALRSVSRHLELATVWEPIPAAREIADRQHLLRTVRYVNLNPCRRRLADDPLEWEWSTHRDLLGLTAKPWVTSERLSSEVRIWQGPSFQAKFHEYVCREDCVSPGALKLPPPPRKDADLGSLMDLERAYAVFQKLSLEECKQRGPERTRLLKVAIQFSEASPQAISEWSGISSRTFYRHRGAKPSAESQSLRECLGRFVADRRLLVGFKAPNVAIGDTRVSEGD